jgi:hypothetical protein
MLGNNVGAGFATEDLLHRVRKLRSLLGRMERDSTPSSISALDTSG